MDKEHLKGDPDALPRTTPASHDPLPVEKDRIVVPPVPAAINVDDTQGEVA